LKLKCLREDVLGKRVWRASLVFLGLAALLVTAFTLEADLGFPAATTLRIATAAACLVFIYQIGEKAFPGERWPRVALAFALMVNVGVFFTPLVERPPSRGELMLFALPDTIVVLVAWLAALLSTGPAADDHQRAVRQQLILGLIIAVAVCATLFSLILIQPQSRP
jgi:Na+-translocating ferredoxin:NAD+ oxidoreductase RnfA subunit